MLLYAVTIFLSAFLLFQIEPIIAKSIVPWFGGSAAVWTTCLLFFQLVLLAGYLYAHGTIRYLKPNAQARLHIGLLALSLLALHVLPRAGWKPTGTEEPTRAILWLLLATVGLPYLLLSTTGPLLQAWYAARPPAGKATAFPYRLYALSNGGSLLALLSYPVAVEPVLTIRQQAGVWSIGYAAFAILCGVVAWRSQGGVRPATEADEETGTAPGWGLSLVWVGLAAVASTLLLAVTNYLTQNVAAIPFLWVLPLSLYLLTFIVCFGGKGWRWTPAFLPLPALAVGAMACALSPELQEVSTGISVLVPLFCGGLFVCCLLCHGELARLKPPTRYLTQFYLMVSVGGAAGGLFVGLLAPSLFRGSYELPVALAACAVVALLALYREPGQALVRQIAQPSFLVMAALTVGLMVFLAHTVRQVTDGNRVVARNFYGVLRVVDPDDPTAEGATRSLANGMINHGEQFLDPGRAMTPTTYYGPQSGIGLAIREAQGPGPHKSVRVGVIGLGTGTLAAYGRPGDAYEFYDINPLVIRLARTQFTFLSGSKAEVSVVPGDARLALERQPPQNFDVLAVDAFSGDAIPVHLLTREAFALYFRHLKPGGVLAVHVSNRYLALSPVVALDARALGLDARVVSSAADESDDTADAEWVLVSARLAFFRSPLLKDAAAIPDRPGLRAWTDDYSNLYSILKKSGDN